LLIAGRRGLGIFGEANGTLDTILTPEDDYAERSIRERQYPTQPFPVKYVPI
jgi:hypothetical protein